MKSLLIDQILTNTHISVDMKKALKRSIVVESSSVSDYYYQGTDQEMWDQKKDFPNTAPPFDAFFLEFDAPGKIISRVYGVQSWPVDIVSWGLLFQTTTSAQRLSDLSEDEKAHTLKTMMEERAHLGQSIEPEMVKRIGKVRSPEQFQHRFKVLPKDLQDKFNMYRALGDIIDLAQQGKWETITREFKEKVEDHIKWTVQVDLFIKHRGSQFQHELGPYFHWTIHVDANGNILENPDGSMMFHYPYEEYRRYIKDDLGRVGEVIDLTSNLLNPALLAISFMHCKNVVLRKEVPPAVQQTAKQKRQRVKPYQPVTYHVLDIEPMKTILKTEGKSEQVGLQRALHICRGHFSTYTEDKKLFGKYAGTFWIPQHVRGSAEVGFATKDYRIKLEK